MTSDVRDLLPCWSQQQNKLKFKKWYFSFFIPWIYLDDFHIPLNKIFGELVNPIGFRTIQPRKKSKFRQQLIDLDNFRVRTLLYINLPQTIFFEIFLQNTWKRDIFDKHWMSFRFLQNSAFQKLWRDILCCWNFRAYATQATSAKWYKVDKNNWTIGSGYILGT